MYFQISRFFSILNFWRPFCCTILFSTLILWSSLADEPLKSFPISFNSHLASYSGLSLILWLFVFNFKDQTFSSPLVFVVVMVLERNRSFDIVEKTVLQCSHIFSDDSIPLNPFETKLFLAVENSFHLISDNEMRLFAKR